MNYLIKNNYYYRKYLIYCALKTFFLQTEFLKIDMNKKFLVLFLICSLAAKAQDLNRQTLSSQGTYTELASGYSISQSIGQLSVIGSNNSDSFFLNQGFQFPFLLKDYKAYNPNEISIVVYPNPFVSELNFQFKGAIDDSVELTIYDLLGRIIHNSQNKVIDNHFTINLENLASSKYFAILKAANYSEMVQIIKNE